MLLNPHFINNVLNYNMFQPVRGHLQGVQLIHSNNVDKQNVSPDVKLNLVCICWCLLDIVIIAHGMNRIKST
jgi:hypothetical protein